VKDTALRGTDVLDTYETERRAVADRTITYSRPRRRLLAPGEDVTGLRGLFGELLTQPGVVRALANSCGRGRRYRSARRPPAGRLAAPDLDLHTPTHGRLGELSGRRGRC